MRCRVMPGLMVSGILTWLSKKRTAKLEKNNIGCAHVKSVLPASLHPCITARDAPRWSQDRPTKWRTHSANRHAAPVCNRPTEFGQRPVFKDFFLTKRPTADRKSQAPPPVFFTPEGGIASRLNYIDMKPSVTKPARSKLERNGLSVDAAAGTGISGMVGFTAEIIHSG